MNRPGNAEWIGEALARYETPLLRFAGKLLRDPDRARDVVQETFLQLCQEDRAAVEGHLAAWLFRVCRNRAIDLRRKQKESHVDIVKEEVADARPDPSQLAQHREDTGLVMRILETLPEHQQEAVYLRFQGGLSYQEIAQITGHTVGNVGFMLHAAVKKIREHMDQLARPTTRAAEGSR